VTPRVPRVLATAAAVVCVAGVVMLVWGALSVGVTIDEPIHVQRFTSYLHTGWYVADFQSRDGVPLPGVSDQYVYGPATMWLLHHWTVLWGGEPRGEVAVSAHAYALRHLGVALIALIGVGAVAATARMVVRRWGWGLVAAACLLATPMFLGHAMFNVKDPSVAAGYALVTAGLVSWVGVGAQPAGRRLLTVASLAAGVWLMLGTRPGMWLALACSMVAAVVLVALRREAGVRGGPGLRHLDLLAALALAGIGLVLLYPEVFTHPLETARISATSSANFLGVRGSRIFVPTRMLLLMPLLLLGLLVLGVGVALGRLVRTRFRSDTVGVRLGIVGVQLVALPTASMIHPSGLYTDLRQLLFIIPPAAVLVAFAIQWLVARAATRPDVGVRRLVTGLACAAIVVPTVDAAALFPFNYTYYNALVDVAGLRDVAPLDYYVAGAREAVGDLPTSGRMVCNPMTDVAGSALTTVLLGGNADCRLSPDGLLHPYAGAVSGSSGSGAGVGETFLAYRTGAHPASNCTTLRQVSRRHGWRRVVLGELASCRVVVASPAGRGDVTGFALALFTASGWSTEQRALGEAASLAFTIPTPGRLSLVIEGAVSSIGSVEVDGRPVSGAGRLIDVTLATAGEHRVTLAARADRHLDVRLLSLAFTAS
jgi:hypothetical protein